MKKLVIFAFLLLPAALWSNNQKVIRISPQRAIIVSVSSEKTIKTDTSQNLTKVTTTVVLERKILNNLSVDKRIKDLQIEEAYENPDKVIRRSRSVYSRESRVGFLWTKIERFDSLAYESYVYRPKKGRVYYKEMIIPTISRKFHAATIIDLIILFSTLIMLFFSKKISNPELVMIIISFFALISILFISWKLFVTVIVIIILVLLWRENIMKKRKKY